MSSILNDFPELSYTDFDPIYGLANLRVIKSQGTNEFVIIDDSIDIAKLFSKSGYVIRSFDVNSSLPEDTFNSLFSDIIPKFSIYGGNQNTPLINEPFYITGKGSFPLHGMFASSRNTNRNNVQIKFSEKRLKESQLSNELDVQEFYINLRFEMYRVTSVPWLSKYMEHGTVNFVNGRPDSKLIGK